VAAIAESAMDLLRRFMAASLFDELEWAGLGTNDWRHLQEGP
jgi:hypothetical protein